MTDLTDDEIEQYEEQLENTSVKALLIEQNAILRALYAELTTSEPEDVQMYECDHCNEQFEKPDQHLQDEHKAPSGLSVKGVDFIEPV